jgi:hypothetical protein
MYVLVCPFGGLTDQLSVIATAKKFCNINNRTLLLHTLNSCYRVDLADFIEMPDIITTNLADLIKDKTLNVNIDPLKIYHGGDAEIQRKCLQNSEAEVIVYASNGLTENVVTIYHMLITFKIKDHIKCIFKSKQLHDYISIHVRNTDYKCDFEGLYEKYKERIHSSTVYLATDDIAVLNYFTEKGVKYINYAKVPKVAHNLHYTDAVEPVTKFTDLLVDIYMLVNSTEIISNSKGNFINLVRLLHRNKASTEVKSFLGLD